MKSLRLAVAAVVVLAPLAVASPAQAAQPANNAAVTAPRVKQDQGQAPKKIICELFPWVCKWN